MSLTLKSCFATLPKTERGRAIVIGGDPKGKNFLYCHGTNVYIRDIDNPAIVDIYAEHAREVTVAKYSPSGFYIASGDITGKVRIWDTVNKEHILKNEFQPLGGKVKDLDWSPESNKILLCGAGREKFATCITFDSGNTVGTLTGHTKEANSCCYKPSRPFKCATAGEDYSVIFYTGPPFKNEKTLTLHSNFVNCVRYAPGGENFISGGADGKAFIFDGKTAEHIGELKACEKGAHNGGIYAISYNRDGSQLLTVSGDKTAKVWDVSTMQVISEFPMGNDLMDMQVGCLWQGDHMLTVSLSGYINYLDKNNPTTPIRIIKGHNKPITALATSSDGSYIYTGTSEASIKYWDTSSGQSEEVKGKGHSNQVQGMVMDGDIFTSIGLDDTIRETSAVSNEYGAGSFKLDSQPKGLCRKHGMTVTACVNHVTVLEGGRKLSSISVKYEPVCVDINPGLTQVAVGGTNKLVIYELSNGALSEMKSFDLPNCNVCAVRYSPDGAFLIEVGSDRTVRAYEPSGYTEAFTTQAHNARICDVAWAPDSNHFATCSIDSSISVWSSAPTKTLSRKIAGAKETHQKSWPNKIEWIDNNTLVTVGQDSCVKQWTVKF